MSRQTIQTLHQWGEARLPKTQQEAQQCGFPLYIVHHGDERGWGLYTAVPLKKGDIITEFGGLLTTRKRLLSKTFNGWYFSPAGGVCGKKVLDGQFVTAMDRKHHRMGSFANAVYGNIPKSEKNCTITLLDHRSFLYTPTLDLGGCSVLMADCDIPAGSACITDYGKNYWKRWEDRDIAYEEWD